jgi:glycosyltransferase involved in cell wall biosynthesis
MEFGVSIIICCYNSALRLPETLRHLAFQQVPAAIPWEIIVIDNASTDATAIVAKQEWEKYTGIAANFVVLEQTNPGKNHAFKTGVKQAQYEYILTCDDDNWLCPDYIARAFRIMQADPKIGALGGCGIFEPQQPLSPEIAGLSSYYVNGPQTWANAEHWVYGAGSLYRKSIFSGLINNGWQQITTGRKGKSLICGEDVEICFMIYLSGYKIVADDNLKFGHFVPLKRQKIAYIIALTFWMSYTHVLLNSYYPILNSDKRPISEIINSWLLATTKTFLKSLVLFSFKKIKGNGRLTMEQSISFNTIYGRWYSLFKNRKRIIAHHLHTKALLLAQNHDGRV